MNQDLYCKMYINCHESLEELYNTLIMYLQGKRQGIRTIRTSLMELDIKANKEYVPNNEDFLYWRYYIDIEPLPKTKNGYIDAIKNLIQFFKSLGIQVVTACNFEDELAF